MLRPFLLALLAALALPAAAQSAAINGFVRDASSGETLIQATVRVERDGAPVRGAATNVSGFYSLGDLEAGTVTVVASYIGFRTLRETVALEAGETVRLDLELQPEGVTSDEVVVEAQESIEEERAPGTTTVSIDLVEALPTVFEADLFRSIQLLPGVKASSDFSSALYIRGGSPDQTLILLDGTTVYNPTHFFGFFSTFNTDAIKDVRLYKGAYPSTYGGPPRVGRRRLQPRRQPERDARVADRRHPGEPRRPRGSRSWLGRPGVVLAQRAPLDVGAALERLARAARRGRHPGELSTSTT